MEFSRVSTGDEMARLLSFVNNNTLDSIAAVDTVAVASMGSIFKII